MVAKYHFIIIMVIMGATHPLASLCQVQADQRNEDIDADACQV